MVLSTVSTKLCFLFRLITLHYITFKVKKCQSTSNILQTL